MRTQPSTFLKRLLPGSRRARIALTTFALPVLIGGALACSGDDNDEPEATQAAIATATATSASDPVRVGGTLIPLDTPTPTPAPATSAAGSSLPPQDAAAMYDLVPCGGEAYYEELTLGGGVHALTYKEVPAGTPILFPFESGTLRHTDAKEGAISLTYDIEGVGVVTIKAAGSTSLERNVNQPVAGTVIGRFGDAFGEEEAPIFAEAQAYAVIGTEEMVQVGDTFYGGLPLDPDVKDCLPLP